MRKNYPCAGWKWAPTCCPSSAARRTSPKDRPWRSPCPAHFSRTEPRSKKNPSQAWSPSACSALKESLGCRTTTPASSCCRIALKTGEPLESILGIADYVLDVNVPPNRGDCQSILGIAREAAAVYGVSVALPSFNLKETGSIDGLMRLSVADTDACPRYVLRMARGISIVPAPFWMRSRITKAGMRPINSIVDVTNYVMLELGQPLHAFDYARIAEKRIEVQNGRRADRFPHPGRPGEDAGKGGHPHLRRLRSRGPRRRHGRRELGDQRGHQGRGPGKRLLQPPAHQADGKAAGFEVGGLRALRKGHRHRERRLCGPPGHRADAAHIGRRSARGIAGGVREARGAHDRLKPEARRRADRRAPFPAGGRRRPRIDRDKIGRATLLCRSAFGGVSPQPLSMRLENGWGIPSPSPYLRTGTT